MGVIRGISGLKILSRLKRVHSFPSLLTDLIYNCPSIFLSKGIPSSAPWPPHLYESPPPESSFLLVNSHPPTQVAARLFRLGMLVSGFEPGLQLLSRIPGRTQPSTEPRLAESVCSRPLLFCGSKVHSDSEEIPSGLFPHSWGQRERSPWGES